MMSYADHILASDEELTPQERNLCASAYKSVVASRRAELKVIQAMESKAKEGDSIFYALDRYRNDITQELGKTCLHIIKLIETEVLPNKHHIKGAEAIVFFKKMVADFNRYLCEFPEEENFEAYKEQAESCYREAEAIAHSNLPQTNPVRLALHLNMSVFLWEISG
jgi:14-3-3 protein epsilon